MCKTQKGGKSPLINAKYVDKLVSQFLTDPTTIKLFFYKMETLDKNQGIIEYDKSDPDAYSTELGSYKNEYMTNHYEKGTNKLAKWHSYLETLIPLLKTSAVNTENESNLLKLKLRKEYVETLESLLSKYKYSAYFNLFFPNTDGEIVQEDDFGHDIMNTKVIVRSVPYLAFEPTAYGEEDNITMPYAAKHRDQYEVSESASNDGAYYSENIENALRYSLLFGSQDKKSTELMNRLNKVYQDSYREQSSTIGYPRTDAFYPKKMDRVFKKGNPGKKTKKETGKKTGKEKETGKKTGKK